MTSQLPSRLSPAEASTRGRLGAHTRWAQETDRSAATEPARAGFLAKFERQVDPDGVLDPRERAIRAEHARKAHMQRLSLRAAAARRAARR